jgi:hypothetical protein
MERSSGRLACPIWLLGDSNPKQWEAKLDAPFDPRHPVRHNIWTSVLDVAQDAVYRARQLRIDASAIYIRNALADSALRPGASEVEWSSRVLQEATELSELIRRYKPVLLISFGAFAFEFARRATNEAPPRSFRFWGARQIGVEHRSRTESFNSDRTNIIPLLHRSIAGGRFLESHREFCGNAAANYFIEAGEGLAKLVLKSELAVWREQ